MKQEEVLKKALAYPDGYADFSGDFGLERNDIDEFIKISVNTAIEDIKRRHLGEKMCSISVGNFLIIVEVYRQEDGKYNSHIRITENYKSIYLKDIEL